MFNKRTMIGIIGIAICVAALIGINDYLLDLTHGCYNVIDVLFM